MQGVNLAASPQLKAVSKQQIQNMPAGSRRFLLRISFLFILLAKPKAHVLVGINIGATGKSMTSYFHMLKFQMQ